MHTIQQHKFIKLLNYRKHILQALLYTEMSIKVDFGGGLEYLFNNKKQYTIILKHLTTALSSQQPTITDLIKYLCIEYCDQQRIDMFVTIDNSIIDTTKNIVNQIEQLDTVNVRPGILVLVNDCDWEIYDCGAYELKDGDNITMISTLHGG